jgi:hypothetical protein
MFNDRRFWVVVMAAIVALYLTAIIAALAGQTAHAAVRVTLIFLVAHLFELPIAFRQLKSRNAAPARVILATLVFGAAWWVPARRGLFAVA